MLRPYGEGLKVYLHRKPIDMRKGRNSLAVLAREVLGVDPCSSALFVFIGKRYDALKILNFDINGFALWHKVIESEQRWHWPRLLEEESIALTGEQLHWLMDGYDVWAGPHRPVHFQHVN